MVIGAARAIWVVRHNVAIARQMLPAIDLMFFMKSAFDVKIRWQAKPAVWTNAVLYVYAIIVPFSGY